ncbi:hypothetical protein [Parasitella parasitica]|uniref:Uncharacterized protein n=1 Tax=Parasitella parasitica TaxID=35722 RepID=A0A0B7NXQ9_9FUNG|nr:hypothetical protein [Parasitella parasitica]
MASSAKETNGTFKGPICYKLSKKSWSEVITGGECDLLTSSAASPNIDHFTCKVTRPYLTGTVPHSLVIDITHVLDHKWAFIVDLATFCQGNNHLWAVSEQIRKENNRLYAEISVSPTMYQHFLQDPTLHLENFSESFMAYPSFSPSANILKLSLNKLPHQYVRQDGDAQLRADMHLSLDQFGKLIDCGYVTGGSGIYAGGGYAVLAVKHGKHAAKAPVPAHHHNTKSKSDAKPQINATTATVDIPVCKHCQQPGHKMTTHRACLMNLKNIQKQTQSDEDTFMDHSEFSADRSTDHTFDASTV